MRRFGWRALAVIFGVLMLAGVASPANAESGDRISEFVITFTIRADGTVEVIEDIDYLFSATGRHGIYRTLITRQPFGDGSDRDVVYEVRDIEVSSPNAPDEWTRSSGE